MSSSKERTLEPDKMSLLSAISTLSGKISGAVKEARENFQGASDVYEFLSTENVSAGIRKLFVMPLYIECFKSLGIQTRAQLEELWRKSYSDHRVRDTVEDLLENEDSICEFAKEVDKELALHEKKTKPFAHVGQSVPKDLALTDADTGEEMQLETCLNGSKFTWFVFLRHFG